MEDAWADMVKANKERDFDDFKIVCFSIYKVLILLTILQHMLEYMKANKGMRFDEMEQAFRDNNFHFYLFALVSCR
jgi:hypothetical protein